MTVSTFLIPLLLLVRVYISATLKELAIIQFNLMFLKVFCSHMQFSRLDVTSSLSFTIRNLIYCSGKLIKNWQNMTIYEELVKPFSRFGRRYTSHVIHISVSVLRRSQSSPCSSTHGTLPETK